MVSLEDEFDGIRSQIHLYDPSALSVHWNTVDPVMGRLGQFDEIDVACCWILHGRVTYTARLHGGTMITEQNSARRLVEDEVRSTAEDCARDGVGDTVVQPANTCAQRITRSSPAPRHVSLLTTGPVTSARLWIAIRYEYHMTHIYECR